MAKAIETLSIRLEFKDVGTQKIISKLSSSLKGMTNVVKGNTSPAISKLRNEILSVGKASTQSISNFRNQANALRALRDEARVGSATFKRLTEDIKKLDAQIAKGQGRKRGGMGARATTQIAGAVVSGGIFGGPEGALGALGGAALGGVEGAFAGAAIGAQLKGIRESLSAAADYASQIQKLQIALRGVAGSQENYNSALETAAQVTRTLNVPQQEAVRGVTRLTAAVTGAGGPIRDAETTFKNVTAAIKATGGSTEDVKGAITAMVQVFSKGKVSAEELSGQLGERLPGAVTLFAKANDMTLPELQKNLKAGTVGLNELMAFIEELGVKYSGTALKIASSNAEAGARLTVAFDDMKAKVGAALLDTGSEFQDTFGEFVRDITPAMVKAAEMIAGAMSALAKKLKPILAGLATFVSIMTGAALVSTVTNFAAGLGLFGVAAKGAATGIGALTASMAINPLFAGALAVSGIVAGIVAVTDALGRQKRELKEISRLKSGQTMATLSNEERLEKITATKALKSTALAELRDRKASGLDYGMNAVRMNELRAEIERYDKRLARLTAPVKKEEDNKFEYKSPTADDDSGSESTLARRIEQAQRLEAQTEGQLRLAQAQGAIGRVLAQQANQRASLQARINKLVGDGTNETINEAAANAKSNLESKQKLELQNRINKLYEQAKRPLETIVQRIKDKVNGDKMYKRLIAEGVNPELAKELVNIDKAFKAGLRKLDVQIENLKATKAEAEAHGKIVEGIDDQIAALERKKKALEGEKIEADTTARGAIKEQTFAEGLDEAIASQEKALKDLINPLNQVKEAANAIGEAFKTSFRGIIDGSMTAKQALASFFQSIADHFADMAAQIAAEAIKLAALKFVQMIISSFAAPQIGSGTGAPVPGATAPNGQPYFGPAFAQGGYVPGGFRAFNQGGVVSQPTLGMVGEGGEPEYIIPQSKMRESMSRYSRGVRGSGVIPDGGGATAASGGGTAVAAPIDVRYTVERINSVDYVTADQFQSGMRQAANQGAKQGEQQTLKRLQMSSGTRKRLGM